MLRKLIVVTVFLVGPGLFAANERVSEPSRFQAGVELGGQGIVYSVFGSLRPFRPMALNMGFVTIFTNGFAIPLSWSILIGEGDHLGELLGGGIISISQHETGVGSKTTTSGFVPQAGIGYRYWPVDGGFHFRATFYLHFLGDISYSAQNVVLPWLGLSFGYAF